MNDTNKNYLGSSTKKKLNSSTLLFLLILLLSVGLIVAGGIWGYNHWEKRQSSELFEEEKKLIFDVQDLKPPQNESTKDKIYEETHGSILSNHRKANKLARKIDEDPVLSQWKEVLEKIQHNLKTLQDLRQTTRESREEIEKINLIVYQQQESLSRLARKIIPAEEIKEQWEFQQKWLENISDYQSEAFEPIKKLMDYFYQRSFEQLSPQEKTPWNIEPLVAQEQRIDPHDKEVYKTYIDYFFTQNHKVQPLFGEWKGFVGFLDKNTETSSKEGKDTMGLTSLLNHKFQIISTTDQTAIIDGKKLPVEIYNEVVFFVSQDTRSSKIELKKELLLTRYHRYYDEWISNLNDKEDSGASWRSLDISEECLLNTIAHELAHAIINTTHMHYQEDNGGHGDLHDEYTDRIEELIKNDSRWEEFLEWWRDPN